MSDTDDIDTCRQRHVCPECGNEFAQELMVSFHYIRDGTIAVEHEAIVACPLCDTWLYYPLKFDDGPAADPWNDPLPESCPTCGLAFDHIEVALTMSRLPEDGGSGNIYRIAHPHHVRLCPHCHDDLDLHIWFAWEATFSLGPPNASSAPAGEGSTAESAEGVEG